MEAKNYTSCIKYKKKQFFYLKNKASFLKKW